MISDMKEKINIMKDRLEVMQFVYSQSTVIGNAPSEKSPYQHTETDLICVSID